MKIKYEFADGAVSEVEVEETIGAIIIRTAGWCSSSAMVWKSARRFKVGSGRSIGFVPDASGRFFYAWK